jgi:rubredoxin
VCRQRGQGRGCYNFKFYSTGSLPLARGRRRAAARFHTMKKYMCLICGWLYDEEQGAPDEGIPPGTRWEDVPPNWTCPECGARKEDFEMIEI